MTETIIFLGTFVISFVGVEILRRWTLRNKILDVPNERSSHLTPTPRGGGLVVVIISLLFYGLGSVFLQFTFHWGFFAGAIAVSLISWLDDLGDVKSVWRFLIHSLSAVLVISTVGYWQEIYVPLFGFINLGYAGAVFTFCWVIWVTNAFNFMDGIDGLAGIQAFVAGIGWFIFGLLMGFPDTGLFGGVVAFASLGFLLHNWHPARIFLGDVGSAFLGFILATIPLLAKSENENTGNLMFLIGLGLIWFFVFDSVVTFVKRLYRKEKVWQAHRDHIYQTLVISGFSHRAVSVIYGLLSSFMIGAMILELRIQSSFDSAFYFVALILSALLAIFSGIRGLGTRSA